MKKIIIALVAVVLCAACFAGCAVVARGSSQNASKDPSEEVKDEQTTDAQASDNDALSSDNNVPDSDNKASEKNESNSGMFSEGRLYFHVSKSEALLVDSKGGLLWLYSDTEGMFEGFDTGDHVNVEHGYIMESDPGQTYISGIELVTDGDIYSFTDEEWERLSGVFVELPPRDSQQVPSNENPDKSEYKLTVFDYWGYLVQPLYEYYKAGEKVEVHLAFLSGPSVGIDLNGEYIGEMPGTKHVDGHPVITFIMPDKDSVLYTTQNGNIGFKSTFSRAGSERDEDIYRGALNASKLDLNDVRHLPVYKFDTFEELEKFKSDFGGESGFNFGWDEVQSFNDATRYYDESFFSRHTLMLVYVDTGSGSYRFGFKDISFNENNLCININQTNNPQECTDDMAAWFITVIVPDRLIIEGSDFDAVLDTAKG